MNIYATFIIKDDTELAQFKGALSSVKPYVKDWYVVANGADVQKVEEYVKAEGGHYFYLPWNDDFSQQRNFIASKLPTDCDYYIWLDADDVLVGGEYLQDLAALAKETKKDEVFLEYWYGCTFSGKPSRQNLVKVDIQHFRERLINPKTHTWKGWLHETPIPVLGSRDQYSKISFKDLPIAVLHLKSTANAHATMARNQRILEKQLEHEKSNGTADPRTLLYLMKIYAFLEEEEYWKKCLDMGKEYLEKSGWDEERATCCDIMAMCYNKLGEDQTAIKLLHDAIREYPHYPLLYLRLAQGYLLVDKPREARHWLEIGVQLPIETNTSGITHVQEMKLLSAQVLLKLKHNIDKDYKGALEAAKIILTEQPNKHNEEQVHFLQDVCDLTDACERVDKLFQYLDSINDTKSIVAMLETLPKGITTQPFAIKWRQQATPPKEWGESEICYYANFGSYHFEKWGLGSLEKGIGGSETAVLELAKEWVLLGYEVTIYGDPEMIERHQGITVLPWYYFNKRDKFNIFIQWRSASLAPHIKCKKFLIDLHDLYAEGQYQGVVPAVDTFMVKSQYHRNLAPNIPDNKFAVVSNGIRT